MVEGKVVARDRRNYISACQICRHAYNRRSRIRPIDKRTGVGVGAGWLQGDRFFPCIDGVIVLLCAHIGF
jgi:hypothetical protein